MNAVVIGVLLMLGLTLARVNVIVAMTLSALVAGLTAGLSLTDTLNAFNAGLSGGAEIALSYAMLGAFCGRNLKVWTDPYTRCKITGNC